MEGKLKKIAILVVVAVLLIGGATIYQKRSSGEGDIFAKALEILKNLKSSALTTEAITTLEGAYQASLNRIDLINKASTGYLATDEALLEKAAKDYIKETTGTGTYTIANLKQFARGIISSNAGYEAGLAEYFSVTKLPCLTQRTTAGGCPEFDDILEIAKRLRASQKELTLRLQYTNSATPTTQLAYDALATTNFGYARKGLCAPIKTATATVVRNSNTSLTVNINNAGSGYTSVPVVTVSDGACTTKPTATATIANGVVTGITLVSGNCPDTPTITIAAPPQKTSTQDPEYTYFDIYTRGIVVPRFVTSTDSPTFTATPDACEGTSGVLKEYRCMDGKYYDGTNKSSFDPNSYTTSHTCPFGCEAGACLLGRFKIMNDPITLEINADNEGPERAVSRVKIGQNFNLRIAADRAPISGTSGANSAEISNTPLQISAEYKSSGSTTSGCTISTTGVDFTNPDQSPLKLGPITCNGASSTGVYMAKLTVSIKNKNTGELVKSMDETVTVGPNTMDKFIVDKPANADTVRGGENATFTIRARGTNGLAYDGFTTQTVLIVYPALPAENNTGSLANGTGAETSGQITIKFPESAIGKTYTIYARGGAYFSDPITINVRPTSKTATATVNGSANAISITLTDGGSGYTTAPTVNFNGGDCPTPPTATATIAEGKVTGITIASVYNCNTRPTTITISAPPQ